MKDRAIELEDFDTNPLTLVSKTVVDAPPDPDRLAAFDEGYAAGWEDSEAAQKAESDQAADAMRAHLQDLSFTWHEARAHVMRSLGPFLDSLVETVVPSVLHSTLSHRLRAELDAMAEQCDGDDVQLFVAPGQVEQAQNLLDGITALPFAIAEDEAMQPGEMHLRLGPSERAIDLNSLQTTLADALKALDSLNTEVVSNG